MTKYIPVTGPFQGSKTKYRLITGPLQGGKTTKAIATFKPWITEDGVLPYFATHATKNVLADLVSKLLADDIHPDQLIQPTYKKREWAAVKKDIYNNGKCPNNCGVVGLNNYHFHDYIAAALLHNKGTSKLLLDEYDTGQTGFDERFLKSVVRDLQIQTYEKKKTFDEICLISATNISGAISSINFDKVEVIKPGAGYSDQFNWIPIDYDKIDEMCNGHTSKYIYNRVADESEGNVMFNLDHLTSTHYKIARAVEGMATTVQCVNSDGSDYNPALLDEAGKHIVIGGNMFARGQTFSGVTNLFLHKSKSTHAATMLQALGRLFGYNKGPLNLFCTKETYDAICFMKEFNERVSEKSFLELDYRERHQLMEKWPIPGNIKILNQAKSGGFVQKKVATNLNQCLGRIPIDTDLSQMPNIRVMQRKVAYKVHAQGRKAGYTVRWGESAEHMAKQLCDAHPKLKGVESRSSAKSMRKFIVPPKAYPIVDIHGKTTHYLDYAHPDEDHFAIQNLICEWEDRDAIKEDQLATIDYTGKFYLLWKNVSSPEELDGTIVKGPDSI